MCDGQPSSITANLADAIRSLRLPDRPRTLWIDQICINQNDIAERSKQVLLMRDIYRNADRVISWLGPDPEANAPAALRFLREIADGHFKDVGDRFAPALQGFLSKHGLPDIGAAEWMSIDALLGLPYFTRVWILQEVILARRLTFLWGHIEISQELLAGFLNWAIRNPSLYNYRGVLLDQSRVFKLLAYDDMMNKRPRTLEACLLNVTSRSCTVEIDRIYSVLGLVDDGPDIVPNYALPAAKVFCDVTLALCVLRKSLDVLGDVHHWEEDAMRPAEWPTWVPRWNRSNPTGVAFNGPFSASATMNFVTPKLVDANFALRLHGIILDVKTVVRYDSVIASQSKDEGVSVADGIQHIWGAWTALKGDTAAMQRNTQLIRDFTWTLLCGAPDITRHEKWSESQIYQDFAAYWADRLLCHVMGEVIPDAVGFVSSRIELAGIASLRYRKGRESSLGDWDNNETWESRIYRTHKDLAELEQDLSEIKPIISGKIPSSYGKPTAEAVTNAIACFYPDSNHANFRRCWIGTGICRSFFILHDGYVGMGPHIMRDTDAVAIIAGSSIPYILRPTAGAYMLVGHCYIHRIMQGELVRELESSGILEAAMRTIVLC